MSNGLIEVAPAVGMEPETFVLKVLLIEDNPIDARLIQIMLAEAGYGAFVLERADRLSSGLARLAQGDIGLALVDLSLPDSHGLTTFKRVYAAAPNVPIIVMSGLDDQTVAVSAVHEGAQDYLVKGQVSGPLLVRAMRYAQERKRTSDQLARYAEELRRKNEQMEADFNMAREIQQVFLPQQYPTFPRGATPENNALTFQHYYLPAAAVGGDFFNVFPITDSIAGAFICDVMGHGMRAALVTAILRGLVEELTPVAADPARFLSEINQSIHAILQRTAQPMLATAFFAIIDLSAGEVRFASAGHPSPFLAKRSLGHVEPFKFYDKRHGPALGLFAESNYPTGRIAISPGDMILLFTDGLYEVIGEEQEEFGQERILASVRRKLELRPPQLFDELLDEVKEFSISKEFDDDVCLLAMEIVRTGNIRGTPS
ncbi:MAG TPA: SpoIIE family protein phosphatase [Candidatus Saccharimonadales bacterium]|nr:SpoIIE family protein phosphatase [Candidatus Saccharimonadales bacterium]